MNRWIRLLCSDRKDLAVHFQSVNTQLAMNFQEDTTCCTVAHVYARSKHHKQLADTAVYMSFDEILLRLSHKPERLFLVFLFDIIDEFRGTKSAIHSLLLVSNRLLVFLLEIVKNYS